MLSALASDCPPSKSSIISPRRSKELYLASIIHNERARLAVGNRSQQEVIVAIGLNQRQKFSHVANTIWFAISDVGVDLPVTNPFGEFENRVCGLDLGTRY